VRGWGVWQHEIQFCTIWRLQSIHRMRKVYTIESKSDVQQSIEENRAQQRERRLDLYFLPQVGQCLWGFVGDLGRETWHVTWSNLGDVKCNFHSFHAVEARSLDRGLRIVKNEMKNSVTLLNTNNSAATCPNDRHYNDYTLEPHFLTHRQNCHDPFESPLKSEVPPSSPTKPHKHCPTCGKKYKSNRRSRCWARFSSMLCCTSDFDSIV
jgi:hypothetical protein